LEEVNLRRPSRATGQIPAERIPAERQRLSPRPIPSADYALRIVVTVRTTGFVEYDGIRYSMPPDTIGIPGTLFLYPDPGAPGIVTREGTPVEHPRWPDTGDTLYRSEHRVAKLAAVPGQRAKLYQKRQSRSRSGLELGPPAEKLLTEWVHHPRMNWRAQVEQLHELLVAHGPARTLAAIERVLRDGYPPAKAIAWVLNRAMEPTFDFAPETPDGEVQ
jgi:hypothetical protein